MNKEESTQTIEKTISEDKLKLKEELQRNNLSFRLAARLKMMLVELSEKTGVTVSNIVEAAVTDYLNSRNLMLSQAEANKGKDEIWVELEKLSPKQIYMLLNIHLRRVNDDFNFSSDTGISAEAAGFMYYNSTALLEIFKAYFKIKKLPVPGIEQLTKDAALGYKVPAFGIPKLIKMSDEELKEILLVITK